VGSLKTKHLNAVFLLTSWQNFLRWRLSIDRYSKMRWCDQNISFKLNQVIEYYRLVGGIIAIFFDSINKIILHNSVSKTT